MKNTIHHLNVVKKHVLYIREPAVFMFKDNLLINQVLRVAHSDRLFYTPPLDPAFSTPDYIIVSLISAWPDKRTKKRTYLAK